MSRATVTVVHWNPPSRVARWTVRGRQVRYGRRVANFGDLLGPWLVDQIRAETVAGAGTAAGRRRLLTVGSILHMARDGDTVWGTGANGRAVDDPYGPRRLDVRAVRGPLTREFLARHGIDAPPVYGDPGLLVARYWSTDGARRRGTVHVPNFHDELRAVPGVDLLDPRSGLGTCLARIASAELVVASSLHGLVVAESFGVPARRVRSAVEPSFKYEDYYRGTGRAEHVPASSVEEAIELGGEQPPAWDPEPLLAAFPHDLWGGASVSRPQHA